MSIFATNEQVEFIARQSLHYDRYSGHEYFLERVHVNGKCGLVCGDEQDDCGLHSTIVLQPVYNEIDVRKISSCKAIYDKYAVFADGNWIGTFTLVLNAWVPRRSAE